MDERIPESIRKQMQNEQPDEETIRQLAGQTLSPAQREKLQSLLGDPQAVRRIMQTEAAQALLRKLQP